MINTNERLNAWKDGSPVHVSCTLLIDSLKPDQFSEEQLNIIYGLLQLAWNGGYKDGYEDGVSAGAEDAVLGLRG